MLPKPGVRHLEQRHLGRAGDDRDAVAAADRLGALADVVRAGRAGRHDAHVVADGAGLDRDHPGRGVHEAVGDERGRDAVRALLREDLPVLDHQLLAAGAGAEHDADVLAVLVGDLEARVRDRLLRRRRRRTTWRARCARTALASIQSVATKSWTSPATLWAYGVGSKRVRMPSPDTPLSRFDQAVVLVVADGADDAEAGDDDAAGVIGLAHVVPFAGAGGTALRRSRRSRRPRPRVGERDGEAVGRGGVVEGERHDVGRDAPDQAGEDAAGADLDERGDAAGPHRLDRAHPVHAGGQVIDELGPAAVGGGDDAGVRVGEERRVRVAEGDAGEDPAHALGGLGHERGVGGDRHRELDGAPGAERLRDRESGLDGRALARDDDLARGVAVRDAEDAVGAGATSSGRRASSRPMIAAIRPSRPAPEACISRPRSRTRRTPSARSSAPAATRAEYWPIEWPAAKAGAGTSTSSAAQRSRTASR